LLSLQTRRRVISTIRCNTINGYGKSVVLFIRDR
jgi:hypothetical protein